MPPSIVASEADGMDDRSWRTNYPSVHALRGSLRLSRIKNLHLGWSAANRLLTVFSIALRERAHLDVAPMRIMDS